MSNIEYKAYLDVSLSFEERARDLVSRMTLREKISQMVHESRSVDHLDIPAYDWWNECLHGVGRAGVATVFPQPIGLASTWNTVLIRRIADAISDEARAKHHEAVRQKDRGRYRGLTFWSPNINIFRDPRWGRGHETFGEDPYLTGRMGVAFVSGLQGDDPKYLKLVATPKHFAVHSGPEKDRLGFNVCPSKKDLRETYLPAFEECVVEGKAASVMTAYNALYGSPCSASTLLMEDILRNEWRFEGYVVSDCGAVENIHLSHGVTKCTAESAAVAVRAGCDMNCGYAYENLQTAVDRGLVTEEEINRSVERLLIARLRLGMFDPDDMVAYARIPYEVNDCEEHRELARLSARQSIVLLKNTNSLLPLDRNHIKSIAVIGPNADSREVLLGNYNGVPSAYSTMLDGIRERILPGTRVWYAEGCGLTGDSRHGFSEAVSAAERSDVVIMCLGLSTSIEGENGDAFNSDAGGDRMGIGLPDVQEELLKTICNTGKPVILVLLSGSAVSINYAAEHVPSILQAWYPGGEGGRAIAEVIFGDYSPAGRLPVTYVKTPEDLPPMESYDMAGRTYRYMEAEPLFPFGFGLSYTCFKYSHLNLSSDRLHRGEPLSISLSVENTGACKGDEVVQLYISNLDAPVRVPIRQLAGFQRITLEPGELAEVRFELSARQFSYVDDDGKCIEGHGDYLITVGGSQGDQRSLDLGACPVLKRKVSVGSSEEGSYL